MPEGWRVALLRRRRCGWRGPCPDPEQARLMVQEVRLVNGREMRELFPGARIWRERVGGLTKSFVAVKGFGEHEARVMEGRD